LNYFFSEMKCFVVFCLIAAIVAAANPFAKLSEKDLKFKTWVVLAAGSSGYINYRHQADVCHAYHALHDLGIPEDHIVVMMVDDIAYNEQNLYPGKVFNDERHINYYEGVPHDYTGNLVTRENFFKILSGEEMTVGSRKSLKSGPDDNVFIYYVDHGNYNTLVFPDGTINSTDVQNVIDTMVSNKLFKNLVIYIEACYSGSMFYKLNLPDNVYVSTAAPVGVSSYGGCIDKEGSVLCDLFSHAWISDLEKFHNADYTFSDQFEVILNGLVNFSQGCAYGKDGLSKMSINEFFGPSYGITKRRETAPYVYKNAISNFDVELEVARRAFEKNPSADNLKKLKREENIRAEIDRMGKAIVLAAKPGAGYLAAVPCAVCDSSCTCMEGCLADKSLEYCSFECCDDQSCYVDPPSGGNDNDVLRRDYCVTTLANEFSQACGNDHPYLLKNTLLFIRVCKQPDVDISNAIREIRSQCSSFNISAF